MNTENIKHFCEQILFGGFLSRFIPGGILYLGFCSIYEFGFANPFIAFFFDMGMAWTMGLLIEFLFSGKYSQQSVPVGTSYLAHKTPLFLRNLGIAMILGATGGVLDVVINDQFIYTNAVTPDVLAATILRGSIVAIIGVIITTAAYRMTKKG